jgi:hypothetical protein
MQQQQQQQQQQQHLRLWASRLARWSQLLLWAAPGAAQGPGAASCFL